MPAITPIVVFLYGGASFVSGKRKEQHANVMYVNLTPIFCSKRHGNAITDYGLSKGP